MLRLLAIVSALLGAHCAQYGIRESEFGSRSNDVFTAEDYPGETHHVVTSDGYILEVHRIPHGKNHTPPEKPESRPVVFLMHGILAGSNSFTHLGSKYSIAYNLADAGYDVWLGNARGNRFSRRHTSLDPDRNKSKFFDFSFEEIGLIDVPAMIDYALAHTKQKTLHYIGHSQGGTVFLVLISMKPEYNKKIASAHLLAGVGYQNNFPNSDLKFFASSTDILYNTMRLAGNVELFPDGSGSIFRGSDSEPRILDTIFDADIPSDLIAGASLKQVAHYGQNVRDKEFRRWNYGTTQNLSKYRRLTPPPYDLSKINIDVTLHYSLSDTLLSEADTLAMVRAIPKAKARKVARDSFTHLDYVTSEDVKELVTKFIIEALRNS